MAGARVEPSIHWCSVLTGNQRLALGELIVQVAATDDVIGFVTPVAPAALTAYLDALECDLRLERKELMLIWSDDARLVGTVQLARNGQPNCRHLAEVSKCMIHPEFRGNQILGQGLCALLARCREREIEVLTIDVRKGSRAETLWRWLGFMPFGELADYARIRGERHAGVWMSGDVRELEAQLRRGATS